MDDDKASQHDEILAIESIYPEILFYDGESRVHLNITPVMLIITLPPHYPSLELPVIELSAPTLTIRQKNQLWNDLNQECGNNIGMPLLFSFISKVKEFIENENLDTDSAGDKDQGDTVNGEVSSTLAEMDTVPELDIKHGAVLTDRKSHFQAHLYPVTSKEEVSMVLKQLLRNNKIARATHNIVAWRIKTNKDGKDILMHDCNDDGENAASSKMLELLEKMGAENVMVVVSRWYGGIQLGPDRFRHINNLTREILAEYGYDKRG